MTWVRYKQRGFTIVELLIVIVVIAILAAITIVAYNGIRNRADTSALQSELSSAAKKIEAAKAQGGLDQFPLTLSDAGVTSGVVSYYSTNISAGRSEYCAEATKGAVSYYITNRTSAPAIGNCTVSDGLVNQWSFNGNANDSVAGSTGTITNATLTTGQNDAPNGAYTFNGTNAYITANTPMIERTSFSTTLWFKTSSQMDKKLISVNTGSYHIIQVFNGGVLRSCGGTVPGCAVGTKNVADGQWHFVAVQGTPTGAQVYLDGATTPELTLAYSGSASITNQIRIGADYTPSFFYNGQIDDVRMYNRPISTDEMAIIYSAGAR